jgi:hypothetical protein
MLQLEYTQNKENLTINRLLGITYNNFGCYYRRNNKPTTALEFLKKALQIEVYSIGDSATVAGTHLNICAVFSGMGK